jgi:hypothetical protein
MSRSKQDSAQQEWVERLCPECGLCCNGVLFADVKLLAADDALVLEQAGLKVKESGRRQGFDQPCACFHGGRCAVYEHRPARCRQFDCHTLKQARNGEISLSLARRRIREAKRESEKVRTLLRALGQQDEHRPLTHRYKLVMSQPLDLSVDDEAAERRGELLMAVNNLMHRLHQDFLA